MSCRLITQGAPLQYCSAEIMPARIWRSTVMGLMIKPPGRFSQGDFATRGPLAIHVDRNSVRVAKATHTRLRPSVQPAGSLSCSVEHTRDGLVGHQARARPDQVHRFRFDGPTRLTSPVLPHREAGVIAALPMQ